MDLKLGFQLFFAVLMVPICGFSQDYYLKNQTFTYEELIRTYQEMDAASDNALLLEMGPTDSGRPLHLMVIGSEPLHNVDDLRSAVEKKAVLLINNGIHAGEPCGIDASVKLARDLIYGEELPEQVLVAIVPVYSIGGMLNRDGYSRANQNGPEQHGFRGNAQNLDLNRDFIKADALNTKSFYALFQLLKPHVFVDTHTSNGADYQYTMTLISTQRDKLNPLLATYLDEKLEPYLYYSMENASWEMTPYVNVFGETPDKGMAAFLESPRYASGYAALFNCLSFVTEAHMLKPYADRVLATNSFLVLMIDYMNRHSSELRTLRQKAFAYDALQQRFPVDWELDSSRVKTLQFKGYSFSYEPSALHGQLRLKYHRDQPKTFDVPYYHRYAATAVADVPDYYVLPAAFRQVAERLQYNGVEMLPIKSDTTIAGESVYIRRFNFSNRPYEGHFPLRSLQVERLAQERRYLKGDWLIPTDQKHRRFLVNVLDPMAVDAYLRWNFFDIAFQQKEWFSAYVFEDLAAEIVRDSSVSLSYEKWKGENPEASPFEHLYFIYQNSPYFEEEYLRYPVGAIRRERLD